METELLLVIFVGVSALAFTVQCLAVWHASRAVKELSEKLTKQSTEMESKLTVVQDRLLEVTEELKPLGNMAQNVSRNVDEVTQTIRVRSEDIDLFLDEVVGIGREQASKIDYLVTDTVQKFEQTTETIQKDVLRPAIEISSFVKGLRAGLGVLFSGDRSEPGDSGKDDEMFI